MDGAIVAGAEVAGAVVRHDNRARRRDDDRSCHDRGRRHDDWRRLCYDNGLRHDRSRLRHDDRSGLGDNRCRLGHDDRGGLGDNRSRLRHDHWSRLCDNRGLGDDRRLRIDDDGGWRIDGFRDIGDCVHDVKYRVEAAVVEGTAVVVMVLSLEVVASQQKSGDGQTEDGVVCVLHGVLLFRWLVCLFDLLVFSVFTKPISRFFIFF